MNAVWHSIDVLRSSTARIVCLFTSCYTWNHQYRLDSTKLNRDQSARSTDGKTSYRGHENRCHTSNGDYLLTAAGRDAESICYVRCVALHAFKCNKYPRTCNSGSHFHGFLSSNCNLVRLHILSSINYKNLDIVCVNYFYRNFYNFYNLIIYNLSNKSKNE